MFNSVTSQLALESKLNHQDCARIMSHGMIAQMSTSYVYFMSGSDHKTDLVLVRRTSSFCLHVKHTTSELIVYPKPLEIPSRLQVDPWYVFSDPEKNFSIP